MATKKQQLPKGVSFGTRPQRPAPMDHGEFEILRQILGIDDVPYPKSWLADALGVSQRQLQRLSSGESDIPGPVARLMRLWAARGRIELV